LSVYFEIFSWLIFESIDSILALAEYFKGIQQQSEQYNLFRKTQESIFDCPKSRFVNTLHSLSYHDSAPCLVHIYLVVENIHYHFHHFNFFGYSMYKILTSSTYRFKHTAAISINTFNDLHMYWANHIHHNSKRKKPSTGDNVSVKAIPSSLRVLLWRDELCSLQVFIFNGRYLSSSTALYKHPSFVCQ
jgi:hypothetical protein